MTKRPEPQSPEPQSPETRLAAFEAEIDRVRVREERKLLAAAEKAGYFDVRLGKDQLYAMFVREIETTEPGPSTLSKLRDRKARAARDRRRDDGRRKALLGGFLVAQCRYRPVLHAHVVPHVKVFLDRHPDRSVAARNRTLLEDFLNDPASMAGGNGEQQGDPPPECSTDEQRKQAQRLILLGTWLLERWQSDPEIVGLVADELDAFLREDRNLARNRALLADLLGGTVPDT